MGSNQYYGKSILYQFPSKYMKNDVYEKIVLFNTDNKSFEFCEIKSTIYIRWIFKNLSGSCC